MAVCEGLLVPSLSLKFKNGKELLVTSDSRPALDALEAALNVAFDKPAVKDWSPCYGVSELVSLHSKIPMIASFYNKSLISESKQIARWLLEGLEVSIGIKVDGEKWIISHQNK
jgi:hypothetical protein